LNQDRRSVRISQTSTGAYAPGAFVDRFPAISQCHFAGSVSYSVQANFRESGAQPPVLADPCPPKKVLTVVSSAPFAATPFSS